MHIFASAEAVGEVAMFVYAYMPDACIPDYQENRAAYSNLGSN